MMSRLIMLTIAACLVLSMGSTPSAQDNWRPHLKALPADVITPSKTPEGWPDLQGSWNVVKRIGGPQHSIEFGIDPEATAIHEWNPAAREASIVIDPPNGRIPYNEKALAVRNRNLEGVYIPTRRSELDPEVRCLLGGVPRGTLLGFIDLSSDLTLYYVILGIFVLSFLLIYRTVNSPFGQVLKAIRENEPRATSLGYDVARFKLLAFVLSAALAGLAGASKTLVLGFATLTDAHWTTSGLVILMVLVGGMGTMLGPILGAFIVVALENKVGDIGAFLGRTTGIEWFNGLGEAVTIVTGLIFVICVMAFRRGLVGEFQAWWSRRHAAVVAA